VLVDEVAGVRRVAQSVTSASSHDQKPEKGSPHLPSAVLYAAA